MLSRLHRAFEQRRRRGSLYSTAGYWDSKAAAQSGSAISMWRNQSLNAHYEREQFRFLEHHLPDSLNGMAALDLGCGTGRVARFLESKGANTRAVDFSTASLEVARKIGPASIDYEAQSVFELEDTDRFDIIVGLGVLTVACKNGDELDDALNRIFKALRPGGTLLLIEPIHAGFLHRVLDLSPTQFIAHMRKAGFNVNDRRELHFWPARLALAFADWPGWLTAIGYHAGRLCMALFGQLLRLGDYRGISARRPS